MIAANNQALEYQTLPYNSRVLNSAFGFLANGANRVAFLTMLAPGVNLFSKLVQESANPRPNRAFISHNEASEGPALSIWKNAMNPMLESHQLLALFHRTVGLFS